MPAYIIVCDQPWEISAGTQVCPGVASVEIRKDVEAVFAEYLAPDPEIIGYVSAAGLVFWITGLWLGKVMGIFRKIS